MAYDVVISNSTLSGTITPPSSKSILHRALFAAALSSGVSKICNSTLSQDIQATLNVIESLGATYQINAKNITVKGIVSTKTTALPIPIYDSATTLRLALPICAALDITRTFICSQRLVDRPLDTYKDIFKNTLFIDDKSVTICGPLPSCNFTLTNLASSQFVSGLLMALPLTKKISTLNAKPPSLGYVDITLDILNHFGITVERKNHHYSIPENQCYQSKTITIEPDFSQAAFFLVAKVFHNALSLPTLPKESSQPDQIITSYLSTIKKHFQSPNTPLEPITIDIDKSPDIAPILALCLSFYPQKSMLVNCARLKHKESDRLTLTKTVLNQLGADIEIKDDTMIIYPIKVLKGGVTINGHNDHRIIMMASIAATIATNPVTITNAHAINKSYPHFFDDLLSLGASIKIRKGAQ